MKSKLALILIVCSFIVGGCATTQQRLLDSESSQVQLRSIQTRAFDTTDKEKTLRTVMSTLQDLEFVIDKADATLGTVSATKLKNYALRMTVTVRPRGETQLLVRANAQYNVQPITDPKPYQQFFASLEKAMFLTAHMENQEAKPTDISTKPKVSSPEKPVTSSPVTPSSGAAIILTVTWTSANIRSGAGHNYPVVTTVKQGDKLTVIGESGEWFNVRAAGGQQGWINNRVVK